MKEFTITVDSQTMWKSSLHLLNKLGRGFDSASVMELTEEEFGEEYGCIVGGQQFDDGVKVNRRDLTFKTKTDATMFLLRWS